MNIAKIFEYFNLDEYLKLSKLNSRIFNYVKKIKHTSSLIEIKRRYLFLPIFNLNSIEEVIKNNTNYLNIPFNSIQFFIAPFGRG